MPTDFRVFFLRQPRWPVRVVPETDDEVNKAVDTFRWRTGISARFSHPALRKLLLPYFKHGWCIRAIEHATSWRPSGVRQSPFSDSGGTDDEVTKTAQFNLEAALSKWYGKEPPVEAQAVEDAYRVFHEDQERTRVRRLSDDAIRASHAARAEAMGAAIGAEQERQSRRRRDRVADCREADRRQRSALGDLSRMAGLHDSENVREITPPSWRNEADRRQQESELAGAARAGYLDMVDELRHQVAAEGIAALDPTMRRVLAHRRRGAKTEASLVYLDKLIEDTRKTG
ncbi:hypothetical protein [Actinophytocola glycyrrhizae]|uniref:Uncharacterized protein n=1 Tax=Actinophytocola glycyrrhizae TaxID=2044873 RepID=A0ABV9SJD3_9PSEU